MRLALTPIDLLVKLANHYTTRDALLGLQYLVFPSGTPSKYLSGSTLLNFGDRTKTGVFNVI